MDRTAGGSAAPFAVALGLALAGAACPASTPPPSVDPLPPAEVAASWPVWLLLSDEIGDGALATLGERWLPSAGGSVGWRPPGQPPAAATAELASRWAAEDGEALLTLALLDASALCRLGTEPGAFGSEVPEGWRAAELACESLGNREAAGLAVGLRDAAGAPPAILPLPDGPSQPSSPPAALEPAVDRVLAIGGEDLRYRFILPTQWTRAVALLPSPDAKASSQLAIAGTSRWTAGGEIPSAAAIRAAAPTGTPRLAAIQDGAERLVARWSRSLEDLAASEPRLDAEARALLMDLVRHALYRDLGVSELDGSRPDVAVVLLDEAAGAAGAPVPGPGLDPVLLCAFARARYETGEYRGSSDILTRIAREPGWTWAGAVADGVARIAVLPSVPPSEVRR